MNRNNPTHLSMRLSEKFRDAVTQYLLVENDLAPADIGIVFGSNCRKASAEKMAELYHNGYVKKIIVTGGFKGRFAKTEAHDIAERLDQLGVPMSDILIENQARNSGENVIFSRALASKKLGLKNIRTVIGVGHITASRRFLMTLRRHWPEVHAMMAPVNIYGVPKHQWHTHKKFSAHVFSEYRKIPHYKALGFIAEVNVDDINRRARMAGPPR